MEHKKLICWRSFWLRATQRQSGLSLRWRGHYLRHHSHPCNSGWVLQSAGACRHSPLSIPPCGTRFVRCKSAIAATLCHRAVHLPHYCNPHPSPLLLNCCGRHCCNLLKRRFPLLPHCCPRTTFRHRCRCNPDPKCSCSARGHRPRHPSLLRRHRRRHLDA